MIRHNNINLISYNYLANMNSGVELIKDTLWAGYTRFFFDAVILDKVKPYVNDKFFVNNFSLMKEHNGSVNFHTHVIDKFHIKAAHSSGITAIADGFFYAGFVGIIGTVLVIFSLGYLHDRRLIPIIGSSPAIFSLFCYQYFRTIMIGDGFLDFYLTRSLFTVSVFPLTIICLHYIFVSQRFKFKFS